MYTELQAISNFSFLRGASRPEELLLGAKQLGYSALALTDFHSLAGIVRAHNAAQELGMKLIVGCRLPLFSDIEAAAAGAEPPLTLLVYPSCLASYGRLCRLLTLGKRRAEKGCCLLTLDDIGPYSAGLLAVLDSKNSAPPAAAAALPRLQEFFYDDRLSIGIARHYEARDNSLIEQAASWSQRFETPLVAVNDVHYHTPERRMLQDTLTCIRHGCTIDTAGYRLFPNSERALKPAKEMARLFRRLPSAVKRSEAVAERAAQFSLNQLHYEYPQEICPAGKSPLGYLKECTQHGACERYPQGLPAAVRKQLDHEFKLIEQLDYAKYFLTVHDIVSFARSRGILCQGRGAAANSAVCYCLGITAVDPSKVNILFERFISKERNEPPDIDIDFEHERREEVIQYLYQKYGRDRAALVAEVITYRSRSAIRDVGKALGLSLDCVDLLAKSINRWIGKNITAELVAEAGLDPAAPRMMLAIELAQEIKGFPRHLSQHVGGFVITDSPLSSMVPIENAAMPDRTVIEWNKDDIDAMGMLKIDILGLGMLTCIRKAFDLINGHAAPAAPRPIPADLLELHRIPPEDAEVYDMICLADTIGVFQIESRAQMSMLPRLRPRTYYDLVIEVAIVRPGPIQGNMIHPYLRRRSGKERPVYPNKEVEKVLGRTLGVPIFQEQAMQLAIVAAGFTPGEADALRRSFASWKVRSDLMERFGQRIINGMKQKGYDSQFIQVCFEQLQGFGQYGFPESHAASFALLVYVSAWLKCHRPAAFAAALINSQPMGFYQPAQIINDAARHGVRIEAIDVNYSGWDCSINSEKNSLRLGMRLVRGLSKQQALKLEETVRCRGPYTKLSELWRDSGVSVHTLRSLAKADAFSSLSLTRQRALWEIRSFRDETLPLFEQIEPPRPEDVSLPKIARALEVHSDYQATGLSLKAHPVSFARRILNQHNVITASMLKDSSQQMHKRRAAICGMMLVRQAPPTAGGVIFMSIEDETGIANLIVRPELAERRYRIIAACSFILASGIIERRDNVVHLLVDDVADVSKWFSSASFSPRNFH